MKNLLPTSALTRSFENTDALTGDMDTDTFDFGKNERDRSLQQFLTASRVQE